MALSDLDRSAADSKTISSFHRHEAGVFTRCPLSLELEMMMLALPGYTRQMLRTSRNFAGRRINYDF
jgi:hypothetical protein